MTAPPTARSPAPATPLPRRGGPTRRRSSSGRARRRWLAAALAALALAAAAGGLASTRRHAAPVAPAGPRFHGSDARAPVGVRVTVEILNATPIRGLGRRAMMFLRDRGFDVVALGTDPSRHDTTLVIDRSGHPEWARLVAHALGDARVEEGADASRYVDVSVLLGATWRPPAQPFYP